MEAEESTLAEPVFRASKRRKVYRRKTDREEIEIGEDQRAPDDQLEQPIRNDEDDCGTVNAPTNVKQLRKPRRHGIAFSSSATRSSRNGDSNEETAMVLAEPRGPQPAEEQNDRFVRPTGKAVVMDDRHMSAFVDSKMAEMRSSEPASSPGLLPDQSPHLRQELGRELLDYGVEAAPMPAAASESVGSTKPATATPKSQSSKPPRRRRQPVRTEADIARDGLIDQIMKESQVPVYDQTVTPPNPSTPGAGGEVDNDAAAAAAFRAEFLAAAEQRNLQRRPPAPPPAGTTHGPKLGGSRAQRERMKAMEEAKGKGK